MRAMASLSADLAAALGVAGDVTLGRDVGGGCISRSFRALAGGCPVFVKINEAAHADLFAAEADGLAALARSRAVRVPDVRALGVSGDLAFLALEWIDLGGRGDWRAFGAALRGLHSVTGERFGWHRDNYIGSTPQSNASDAEWPRFFARRRLEPQLELARRNGLAAGLYDPGLDLCERLGAFFSDHAPPPSLVHGDLWSGNAAFADAGEPVVFDPAAYYGDPETDLAMTELFGGFPADFYAGYHGDGSPDPGWRARRELYKLYHVLNHANLFGAGYARQAASMIQTLLAETRR